MNERSRDGWTMTVEGYICIFFELEIRVVRIATSYNAWQWFILSRSLMLVYKSLAGFHVVPFPLTLCFQQMIVFPDMSWQHEVCNLVWFSRWRRGGVDATMPTASHQRSDPSHVVWRWRGCIAFSLEALLRTLLTYVKARS